MIPTIIHVVSTVRDIDAAAAFYARGPGIERREFGAECGALHFGTRKIDLQTSLQETSNHAAINATDVYLRSVRVVKHPLDEGVRIAEGPAEKTDARGAMNSVYFNGLDDNLIEVSSS